MILIFFGPISHRLIIRDTYKIPLTMSMLAFLIGTLAHFSLSFNTAIFITLFCNIYGKTILDTIFITEKLVIKRSLLNIALDFLRSILILIGFITPLIFVLPLLIELLFLFFIIDKSKYLKYSNQKFSDNFLLFNSFWWILSQRVSSLIFIFYIDRLEDPYIYSYCILLATQISGLLETILSVYWFEAVSELKRKKIYFAHQIVKIIRISYFVALTSILLFLLFGNFIIELTGKLIDIVSVIVFASNIFVAKFATLNINHLVIYSSKKSIFNIIFLINIGVFTIMYFFNTLPWYVFLVSFLVTSTIFVISAEKIFSFSLEKRSE